jgi:hypothetical protein
MVMVAAIASAMAVGSAAQASPISYSYAGSPAFQIVHPDAGNGGVAFVGNSGSVTGSTGGALGALLFAVPSNENGTVGTFTHVGYTTGLTVTDTSMPGSPHTFTFSGELNGTLLPGTNTLTNTYTGPTSQSWSFGNHSYTVTINNMALPGIGGSGAVTYNIQVSDGGGIQRTPEPSTLMLSGLGASFLGLFSWRRRLKGKVA